MDSVKFVSYSAHPRGMEAERCCEKEKRWMNLLKSPLISSLLFMVNTVHSLGVHWFSIAVYTLTSVCYRAWTDSESKCWWAS